jgi:hypothetical protein
MMYKRLEDQLELTDMLEEPELARQRQVDAHIEKHVPVAAR